MLLALSLAGATYAWFTFATVATVDSFTGKIGSDGVNLVIANNPDGPFAESCELILDSTAKDLKPITTTDLEQFFIPVSVDLNGDAKDNKYRDVTAQAGSYLWHGTVWLKSEDEPCTVFLDPELLYFGEDKLALSAMRCGLRFHAKSGTITYLFETTEEGVASVCRQASCKLEKDEVAAVEYWLFLDGNDPECKNPVQAKDVSLQLGFFGGDSAKQ